MAMFSTLITAALITFTYLAPKDATSYQSIASTEVLNAPDSSVGEFSSLTIGLDGLPVMSYYDSSNQALKVLKCTKKDCSDTANNIITVVDNDADTSPLDRNDYEEDFGQWSSIIVGSDGLPIVAYYERTYGNLKVAKCGNPACSSNNKIVIVDTGRVGVYPSIAIGKDGLPVVTYHDLTFQFARGNLKFVKCGALDCSTDNIITTVDSVGDTGHTPHIAVPQDGLPIISYYIWGDDNDNGVRDLKFIKCGNVSCTGENTIVTLDDGSENNPDVYDDVGAWNAITVGSDNLPVITYQNYTQGQLKLIKCAIPNCSNSNIKKTLDGWDTGYGVSVKLNANNIPYISYRDAKTQSIKLLKCADQYCSSNISVNQLDGCLTECIDLRKIGIVGIAGSSTALSENDLPIVSYYDYVKKDLKVSICLDQECNSNKSFILDGSPLKYLPQNPL